MNSAVLTASLTGRIQIFYCVALLRTSLNHCYCNYGQLVLVHPSFAAATPRLRRTFERLGFEV